MAVSINGTPLTNFSSGGAFTATAGTDRLLVSAHCCRIAGFTNPPEPALTAAAYGAAALAVDVTYWRVQGPNALVHGISRLLHASIPGGSNALNHTWTETPNRDRGVVYELEGVDQTNPLVATDFADAAGAADLSVSFAVEDGGIAILAVVAQAAAPPAIAGYTQQYTVNMGNNANMAVYHKLITADGTENVTIPTADLAVVKGMSAASYRQVAASGPTASGAATLPAVTGAGTAIAHREASGAATLPGLTAAGTAKTHREASGAATLPGLTAAGTAETAEPPSASGAATLPALTAAGTAKTHRTASGAATLPALTAAGTATAPFTPANLFSASETGVWYEPSPANCFQNSNGTGACAVGDPVGYLTDLSGNGHHAIQATSGSRPILRQDAAGNYYLEFDATDDYLRSATSTGISGGQASTEYLSARFAAVPSTVLIMTAYGINAGDDARQLGTQGAAQTYRWGVWGANDLTGGPAMTTDPFVQGGLFGWTTDGIVGRVNGAEVASKTTAAAITTSTTTGFTINANPAVVAAQFAGVEFYGAVTVGRTLTTPELDDLEAYMAELFESGVIATGAATLPALTASGTAELTRKASGAATLPGVTAAGTAKLTRKASGAALLPAPTAAGTATTPATEASGAATLPAVTGAGTAALTRKASGAATLPAPTAAGTAALTRKASGAATLPALTAAGAASLTRKASGAADLPVPTAAGTATVAGAPEAKQAVAKAFVLTPWADGSYRSYPEASAITGISFNYASAQRLAIGSDNWPLTWSDDDHQYALWGDGGGFGGTNSIGRVSLGVARIEGDHDAYTGFNRYGGLDPEFAAVLTGKGNGAPISIGGVIYFWRTPLSGTNNFTSMTLCKSTDKCASLADTSVQFTNATHGVGIGSFVNHGQDNALGDGFVYTTVISLDDTSVLSALQDNIYLLRVAEADIETQAAYEWWTGAGWGIMANRQAIYSAPGEIGCFPQMCYVPGLNRYVMTVETGGLSADFRLLEAPAPEGPWTVVTDIPDWGVADAASDGQVHQWNFAPKWFRNGGLDFTMTYSGAGGGSGDDSFNSIDGSFTV